MKNGMYEIVQQTNYITEKQIEDGIKNGFKSILQYAYILHDKDTDKDGISPEASPPSPTRMVFIGFPAADVSTHLARSRLCSGRRGNLRPYRSRMAKIE